MVLVQGLALDMTLTFYTSLAKELKLKVRKFQGIRSTFVEVTMTKLVGYLVVPPVPPILNRVNVISARKHVNKYPMLTCYQVSLFHLLYQ